MTNSKFELRRGIRAAAPYRQGQEVLHPEAIEDRSELSFDRLIEQFGSVAHAAIQGGVPYLNTTTNERAIVGETGCDWRVNAITTVQALAGAIDPAPDIEAIAVHINRNTSEILETFGSRNAVLREAGIDPVKTTDAVPIHKKPLRSGVRHATSGLFLRQYMSHTGVDFP